MTTGCRVAMPGKMKGRKNCVTADQERKKRSLVSWFVIEIPPPLQDIGGNGGRIFLFLFLFSSFKQISACDFQCCCGTHGPCQFKTVSIDYCPAGLKSIGLSFYLALGKGVTCLSVDQSSDGFSPSSH